MQPLTSQNASVALFGPIDFKIKKERHASFYQLAED
jgi:hypothetical protein